MREKSRKEEGTFKIREKARLRLQNAKIKRFLKKSQSFLILKNQKIKRNIIDKIHKKLKAEKNRLQAKLKKQSDAQMKKKLKLKINLIEKNIKQQREKLQKILKK